MAFFGKKIEETPSVPVPAAVPERAHQQPTSQTRVSGRSSEEAHSSTTQGGQMVFGIDNAIALMRSVPMDQNADLVIKVVRATLESLNVRVSDIVRDAEKRQGELEGRISVLKGEIGTLEKQMELRVAEIVRLEAAHSETSTIRQRLNLTESPVKNSEAPKPHGVAPLASVVVSHDPFPTSR